MNTNVFLAAADRKVDRVVWASSETTLGLPFDVPPKYAPVDEAHYPFPTSTYSLSKVVAEAMAEQVSAWSGIPFVALRLSNVLDREDYEAFPSYWPDAMSRKWNLWGYIDARDAASAFRHALEATTTGVDVAIIANDDTVMDRPSADLHEGGVPRRRGARRARRPSRRCSPTTAPKQLFGWRPEHSWRDEIGSLMRVLVIGATGHVGGYLVPSLVRAGHDVAAMSRGKQHLYREDDAWDVGRDDPHRPRGGRGRRDASSTRCSPPVPTS